MPPNFAMAAVTASLCGAGPGHIEFGHQKPAVTFGLQRLKFPSLSRWQRHYSLSRAHIEQMRGQIRTKRR